MLTDESRFCLKTKVWRPLGERYAQYNIIGRDPYGGESVMVLGGISLGASTYGDTRNDNEFNFCKILYCQTNLKKIYNLDKCLVT